MKLCLILTTMTLLTDLVVGSPTLQKLVFSADDIKGWRFLPDTSGRDVSFIYVMNTTDICFNAICSQECDLTIVSHEEGVSYLQNGTLNCQTRLQQCKMTSNNGVSFNVQGSCSNSSDHVRIAIIDYRAGVCGDDPPFCFKNRLETTMTTSKMASTSQPNSTQSYYTQTSSHQGAAVNTTTDAGNSTGNESTASPVGGNYTKMTTYSFTTALPTPNVTTDFDNSTRHESTTFFYPANNSNITTFSPVTTSLFNETNLINATVPCCVESRTSQTLPTSTERTLSKLDMDIALGVTVSLSVLVVSGMLFLIGRLLYRTRHVTKMETSVASFDIVNPSEGVFEDPSGFLSETYIHIRKVSESNTEETPTPSPSSHNQDSTFDLMTAGNPRSHYGGCSTFTGRHPEGFPHRYTAYSDRRMEAKPRK